MVRSHLSFCRKIHHSSSRHCCCNWNDAKNEWVCYFSHAERYEFLKNLLSKKTSETDLCWVNLILGWLLCKTLCQRNRLQEWNNRLNDKSSTKTCNNVAKTNKPDIAPETTLFFSALLIFSTKLATGRTACTLGPVFEDINRIILSGLGNILHFLCKPYNPVLIAAFLTVGIAFFCHVEIWRIPFATIISPATGRVLWVTKIVLEALFMRLISTLVKSIRNSRLLSNGSICLESWWLKSWKRDVFDLR